MQVRNCIALSPLVLCVACNLANAYAMCGIGVYVWVRGLATQKKNLKVDAEASLWHRFWSSSSSLNPLQTVRYFYLSNQ